MPRQTILSNPAVTSILLPTLFVFLWSTGFIGSKVVTQHAPPLTFLAMRMTMAAIVLFPILFITKSRWPTRTSDYVHSAVVGALVHAVYLGGVFWAISLGTGAGLSALIVGLQPVLTLCLSVIFLAEKAGPLKIAGVLTGFAGFIIVIAERTGIDELSTTSLLLCTASLIGISAGTVYQKKITASVDCCPVYLFSTSALSCCCYHLLYYSSHLISPGIVNLYWQLCGWSWCFLSARYCC